MEFEFVDVVVDWFARNPLGPLLSMPKVADNPPATIRDAFQSQLDVIPDDLVEGIKTDDTFCLFYPGSDKTDIDHCARVWLLMQGLTREIPRRRLIELVKHEIPLSSHAALSGVSPDDEGLLPA